MGPYVLLPATLYRTMRLGFIALGSSMRHFGHIAPEVRRRLFHREPCAFTADGLARLLAAALGATLYSPATRPRLADDIVKQAGNGVVSMVLCLEDSIDDADVVAA